MRLVRALLDRRPAWLDLAIVAIFILWFYRPFLAEGAPSGDFGSDAMVSAVDARLVPSILSVPSWNPYLMCGRPILRAPSPLKLLALPFAGWEPIERLKGLVLLYLVLAGWAMVALLRGIGAGGDAALFAGLLYPIGAAPVTRTAVFGHVVVPMLYALIPLFFLALFRMQDGKRRSLVLLALAAALCLHRDAQRTLLLCLMVGIVVTLVALAKALFGKHDRSVRGVFQAFRDPARYVVALSIAVALNAFDLLNGFLGDPFRGGWRPGEQAGWMDRWSNDNLYSLLDRNGAVGRTLEPLSPLFDDSASRYVGISLLVLIALGALAPKWLGAWRARFWTVLLLLPLSVWLSFGSHPIIGRVAERLSFLLREPAILWIGKAAALLCALVCVGVGSAAVVRNIPAARFRTAFGLVTFAILVTLFLCTAPLPLLRKRSSSCAISATRTGSSSPLSPSRRSSPRRCVSAACR